MPIIQCENGHHFDSVKTAKCPYCNADNATDLHKTVLGTDSAVEVKHILNGYKQEEQVDSKTVSLNLNEGQSPVVGWLVCVAGDEKGRDYRLHGGRNFIGRSYGMDVVLTDDNSVSRNNHCSIVFDPISGGFLIAPGLGTTTFLNGEPLVTSTPLDSGHIIEIGRLKLEFVPYCKGDKKW